jgi:hypothetical protein
MKRDPFAVSADLGEDCDIVREILQLVIELTSLDPHVADGIEAELRARYGGQRVRIPKRGKHLRPEQRAQVFQEALTDMPTEEILKKHKISARSLRRWLKQG